MRVIPWIVAGAVLVALVIAGWVLLRRNVSLDGHVAQLKDQLRAAGIPVDIAELRPPMPIPEEQDAGPVYQAQFKRLRLSQNTGTYRATSRLLHGDATAEQKRLVERGLKELELAFTEIERASRLPYCDFHWKYEEGSTMMQPELGELQSVLRWFRVKSRLETDSGNPGKALSTLATLARVEGHIGQLPTLIVSQMAHKLDRGVLMELKYAIEQGSRDPKTLEMAGRLMNSLPSIPDVRKCAATEVPLGLVAIDLMKTVGDLERTFASPPNASASRPLTRSFLLGLKASYLKLNLATLRDLPSSSGNWSGFERGTRRAEIEISKMESSGRLEDGYASVLVASFALFPREVAQAQAERRMAATSIRLYQYRATRGRLPDKLPDYGLISQDPIDGKSLRYSVHGSGFTLYSIGFDRIDHGGHGPGHGGATRNGYDDVWMFAK